MNRNLKPIAQFVRDSGSAFTEPQIRWHVFNRAHNGMDAAGTIVRVGRRIYIDVDGFDRWIAAQNTQRAAA